MIKLNFIILILKEKVNKLNIYQFLNYLNFVKEKLVNEKELNIDELNINYQFNEVDIYTRVELNYISI